MDPNKRYVVMGSIAALIIALGFFFHFIFKPSMTILYSNLDMKDSGEVISILDTRGIDYELQANGTQILVPENQAAKLRIELAAQGIPAQGAVAGYEIFDKQDSFGTSTFVLNVNLQRALEGELAKTIASMQNIDSAKVLLVMPKKELFSRERQKPSASVFLKLRGYNSIGRGEIRAIEHLVATAVPGLEPNMITIVDNRGVPLKIGGIEQDSSAVYSSSAEEYRRSYENRLQNEIQSMLEMSLGIGNVRVNVVADINFDRVVTNSETYDPSGRVERSVQHVEEISTSKDHITNPPVSVSSNLPGQSSNPGGETSGSSSKRIDDITNYEISKTVTNHVNEVGTIERLSVAVLVDGTYTTDPKTKKSVYHARTPAELQQIDNLVKSAMGYEKSRHDKVEVINMKFANFAPEESDTLQSWVKSQLSSIIQMLIIGIVVILVVLLVIRPVALKAFEISKGGIPETDSLSDIAKNLSSSTELNFEVEEDEEMIDINSIIGKDKNTQASTVNNVLDKYPKESLAVLRKWLGEM